MQTTIPLTHVQLLPVYGTAPLPSHRAVLYMEGAATKWGRWGLRQGTAVKLGHGGHMDYDWLTPLAPLLYPVAKPIPHSARTWESLASHSQYPAWPSRKP